MKQTWLHNKYTDSVLTLWKNFQETHQIPGHIFQGYYSTEAKIALPPPGWKDLIDFDQKKYFKPNLMNIFMTKEYEEEDKREQVANINSCTNELNYKSTSKVFDSKAGIEGTSKVKNVTSVLLEDKTKKENKCEKAPGADYKKKNKKKPLKFKKKFPSANPSTSLLESMVLLVSIGLLPQAYSMPMNQDIFTYDLLITKQCNRRNFDRSQSCQLSEHQLAVTIQHCGFQAMCQPGYEARCVNTLQGGMAHICALENMSCQEGLWRKAWIDKDNPDLVRVKEEKCPSGRFQQYKSNCFDACSKRHLDTNAIPERYALHTIGDNISPTYVYCNNKKGYFNMENITFLDYDQASHYFPDFCLHVREIHHFCNETKYPLPHGTCVSECMPEECRDDHDEFICKRNCGNETSNNGENDINGYRNEETLTEGTVTEKSKTHDKPAIIPVCFLILLGVIAGVLAGLLKRYSSVTKKKYKNVTYKNINIHSEGNMQVLLGNGHAVPNTENIQSKQNCTDNHSQVSIDEPQMENLKFPGNQVEDSGIASLETTYVKRPY